VTRFWVSPKLIIKNSPLFENNYNKLCCGDCRAFHAASCGVFYFSSDKPFLWWNGKIIEIWFVICQKSYLFLMMEVWSSKFCPVWKQKMQLRDKCSCVNCRAFHAASYGVLCLSIPCIKGSKTAMQSYNEQEWWRNESYQKFVTIILCKVWSNSIER